MGRVLVVEDSPTQAAEIAAVLEDGGFEVECVEDGLGALRCLETALPVELVLVDALMPGMSGFELCRELKRRTKTRGIPVLLLTTLDSVIDIVRGLECGADGYMTKPCKAEVLIERVRECVASAVRSNQAKAPPTFELAFEKQRFVLPADPQRVLSYLLPVLENLLRVRPEQDGREDRGQEALRRSEERFALAAAGANDGLWDWDLPSGQMYVSPRFNEIAGLPGGVATTDAYSWADRVHPDDVERLKGDFAAHLEGRSSQVHAEFRLLAPDGSCRWVLVRGCCVRDGRGRPYRMAGSLTDIAEQKKAQEDLLASREDLQLLARRLYAILEDERTMTAHRLHSRIGQRIAAAQGPLTRLLRQAAPRHGTLCESAKQALQWIDEALQETFKIASDLRSPVMGARGLAAGVRSFVVAFQRRTGVECRLMLPAEDPSVDLPRSSSVFRILQEALANVAAHAGATQAAVCLTVEEDELVLEVKDNGKGIDPAALTAPRSLGLAGMRERARQWGGDVVIVGTPGHGTVLTARIPLTDRALIV